MCRLQRHVEGREAGPADCKERAQVNVVLGEHGEVKPIADLMRGPCCRVRVRALMYAKIDFPKLGTPGNRRSLPALTGTRRPRSVAPPWTATRAIAATILSAMMN